MVDRYFADAELAALYDAFNPPRLRADFAFYLPMVLSAQAVLDVGCGTGAMLAAARSAGHTGRLCGLDPGAGMIEAARGRPDIEWVLGDLASVSWRSQFDLVVMTGHAFQALIEDDEIRASLAAVHAALSPGGRFAFETRNPLAQTWPDWTSRRPAQAAAATGEIVSMERRVETEFDGRTLSFSHTFSSDLWDQPKVSRSTLRFLDAGALNGFLTEAGLAVEAQFGDWDGAPLEEGSPEIITLARPMIAGEADGAELMRQRLQADLRTATKARAHLDVAVLRGLIAAIDNAGAVPLPPRSEPRQSEVARRHLTIADVQALIRREYELRQASAGEFTRLGRSAEAARASLEARLVSRYLSPPLRDTSQARERGG